MLTKAIENNDIDMVNLLLDYTKNHFDRDTLKTILSTEDREGNTLIWCAITTRNIEILNLLLDYAADHSDPNTLKMMLSAKDRKGNTPIMDALDRRHFTTVAMLVNKSYPDAFTDLVREVQKYPEKYLKVHPQPHGHLPTNLWNILRFLQRWC